jgi:hypothetical protein
MGTIMSNETPKHAVKINFDNEKAAMHFLAWLCESGEQKYYWDWMRCREEDEEEGNITAFEFDYFRGGKRFGKDLEIDAECGRIDAGYKAV